MKNFMKRVAAALTAIATVGAMLLPVAPVQAAAITSTSDTMSRLKISTTAVHVIRMTLPLSYNFSGSSTTSDMIAYDFPAGFTASASGTWQTTDFSFNDGTARTVTTVSQGTGVADVSCSTGVNDVGVAIDTSANVFRVKACSSSYTSSTSTSTVTFTIQGTSTTGNGTLTNPSSAGSQAVDVSMTDNGTAASHTTTFAVSIMDDDQVTVTATVSPSLTFDIDIQASCGSESAAPYTVSLGTLTSAAIATASNHICLELATNATGGAIVTVQGSGNADGLESVAAGSTIGTTYTAGAAGVTTLSAGTVGYGLCVSATSVVTGSATAVAPFNGNCTTNGGSRIGGVPFSAPAQILTSNGAAISGTSNNTADILVKAAISGVTPAANDYTDVLTFIATGTF